MTMIRNPGTPPPPVHTGSHLECPMTDCGWRKRLCHGARTLGKYRQHWRREHFGEFRREIERLERSDVEWDAQRQLYDYTGRRHPDVEDVETGSLL